MHIQINSTLHPVMTLLKIKSNSPEKPFKPVRIAFSAGFYPNSQNHLMLNLPNQAGPVPTVREITTYLKKLAKGSNSSLSKPQKNIVELHFKSVCLTSA